MIPLAHLHGTLLGAWDLARLFRPHRTLGLLALWIAPLAAQTAPGWAQVLEERMSAQQRTQIRHDAVLEAHREILVDLQVQMRAVQERSEDNKRDILELRWWVLASALGGGLTGGVGSGWMIRRKLNNGG